MKDICDRLKRRLEFVSLCVLLFMFGFVAVCARTRAASEAKTTEFNNSSFENMPENFVSQEGSSQTGSGTVLPNGSTEESSGLARYPDRRLTAIPKRPLSMRFVVEHRSALNGRTITIRGIVASIRRPTANEASPGVQIMSYPQPAIVVSDTLRKRRDKNFDLMVLLGEGENRFVPGRKIQVRVKVSGNKDTVVLRKES